MIGTGKLIIGSILVVVGWLLTAIACGILFGAIWGALLFFASPALACITLRWGETWEELRKIKAYRWLYLRNRSLVEALIARRRALARQIMETVQAIEGELESLRKLSVILRYKVEIYEEWEPGFPARDFFNHCLQSSY